jgi:hypothetical protein
MDMSQTEWRKNIRIAPNRSLYYYIVINIFLLISMENNRAIYTHYIHSVVVQDVVSGRVCCVKQYHYESR